MNSRSDSPANGDRTSAVQQSAVEEYHVCIREPGRALRVWTCNTVYEIRVTDPARQRVVIRGGHFGEAQLVRLAGARLSSTELWHGSIFVGLCLELHTDGRAVVTSPVRRIDLS